MFKFNKPKPKVNPNETNSPNQANVESTGNRDKINWLDNRTPSQSVSQPQPIQNPKARPQSFMAKVRKGLSKKSVRIILIAIAAVIVAAAAFLIINYATMPVKISRIETTKALSSRVEDAPIQNSFKYREPIMLHFEFYGAQVGSGIKFEVKNQEGKVVKSGTTTVLRPTDSDPSDGQRFVSIVNTPSTALDMGRYTIHLSFENRSISSIGFEITE